MKTLVVLGVAWGTLGLAPTVPAARTAEIFSLKSFPISGLVENRSPFTPWG